MLSAKRERFCQEYAIDQNAKQAAIRAKYSERTAEKQGSALLKNHEVRARVDELLRIAADKAGITLEMVVKRLALFAFTDLDDIVDNSDPNNPRLKSPLELNPEDIKKRGVIQEITVNRTGGIKFKSYSAQAALDSLKSILMGPADVKLQLSGEVIQKIERVIVDPKGEK